MNELISVIVPIYKVDKYLDRCLNSLVNQTYTNLEIILIDDGSPDNCPQLCDVWAQKDNRIKVIHKKNGGSSSARNAGLDIAKGAYIGFVDSDDYVALDMYEKLYSGLRFHNAEMACCGRILVKDKQETPVMTRKAVIMDSEQAMKCLLLKNYMDEAAWDKLYKRELFEIIRFPLGVINEDIVVLPEIIDKCNRIVHVGFALYYYWQNPIGITKSGYSEKNSVVVEHMKFIDGYIKTNHPQLIQSLRCFQARYALDMLENLLSTDDAKKQFYHDYLFYMQTLKKNYFTFFKSKSFRLKFKLKGILVLIGLYAPCKKLLKGNRDLQK